MATFSQFGRFGRWGNMLFQFAATMAHSKRMDESAGFPLDAAQDWAIYFEKPLPTTHYFSSDRFFAEDAAYRSFHYQPLPERSNLDLLGYFQSSKYFKGCEEAVREALIPNKRVCGYLGDNADFIHDKTVAVHVRRGDYVRKQHHHALLSEDYYKEAMSHFDDCKYLVFGEDSEWIEEKFRNMPNCSYVEPVDPIIDMLMMSMCTHNIIANSSLSWWAAWINNNANKRVIAPKQWFGPACTHYDLSDLYEPEWMVI